MALDEEKADPGGMPENVDPGGMLEHAAEPEASAGPGDLPDEQVLLSVTANGDWEGLMVSCPGVHVSVLQGCCGEAGAQSLCCCWPWLHRVL